MFFPRLRRQAKWVFMFLALAFMFSFVLFDVGGSGYGGITDLLSRGVGGTGQPDAGDAREKIKENPRNAAAYRELSTALQGEGKIEEAIPPLVKYVELAPNDLEARRELAGLYLTRADRFRREALAAQAEAQAQLPGATFQPDPSSQLGQALGQDPIQSATSTRVNARLSRAFSRMQGAYGKAVATYKGIAARQPNDPRIQFELAQAAEAGGDLKTAIAAYSRFVKLAPDDPTAPQVREHVKQLEAQAAVQPGR